MWGISVKQMHLQYNGESYMANAFATTCEFIKIIYLPIIEHYTARHAIARTAVGKFLGVSSEKAEKQEADAIKLPSMKVF